MERIASMGTRDADRKEGERLARLLIVDNEKIIVDGLVGYFLDLKLEGLAELEVFGAHSGAEALAILEETKIDLVLSDIRMPGMSGLELQREVVRRWPRCKVIFLSGYDEFPYIQQAMRIGADNYILKTEGYEAIAEAVRKSLIKQQESAQFQSLLDISREQFQAALPLMGKDLMTRLLLDDPAALTQRQRQFEKLQIMLDGDEPVLLMIGRIDHWRGICSPSDRALIAYSIQNIAEEYLRPFLVHYSFVCETSRIIWFLQPRSDHENDDAERLQRRALLFVQHSVEDIQATCRSMLHISLSFAIGRAFKEWPAIPESFEALKLLLNRGLGMKEEAILLEPSEPFGSAFADKDQEGNGFPVSYHIHKLQNHLENGERNEFYSVLGRVFAIPQEGEIGASIRLEIALSLGGIFLSAVNRWGIGQEVARKMDLDVFSRIGVDRDWKADKDAFLRLADILFANRSQQGVDQGTELTEKIQNYIKSHLSDDLTMTRLGTVFNHNPYYLSRLYKQIVGISLLDYITEMRMERAKQLLVESDLRIQDISKAVGFISEGYFYRFFKKTIGMTPSEFRERPKL